MLVWLFKSADDELADVTGEEADPIELDSDVDVEDTTPEDEYEDGVSTDDDELVDELAVLVVVVVVIMALPT